jgi:hypothetical protein
MDKCPQCGYREKPASNERHTIMNYYIGSNGVEGYMNRTEEKFTIGEGDKAVNWVRKDVKEKEDTKAPAPKTPTPPAK